MPVRTLRRSKSRRIAVPVSAYPYRFLWRVRTRDLNAAIAEITRTELSEAFIDVLQVLLSDLDPHA
jgi:hypothetical protein